MPAKRRKKQPPKEASVACPHCSKEFDYAGEPEVAMGAVACPHCGETLHQGQKAAAVAPAPPTTGPEALMAALQALDLDKIEAQAIADVKSGKKTKRHKAVQVLNTIAGLRRNKIRPDQLMLRSVPVIPPAFRPFTIVGDTMQVGSANELYRDLIKLRSSYANMEKTLGSAAAGDSRLSLYDAVRAVHGFGEPVEPKTAQRGASGFLKQITGQNPKHSWMLSKMIAKPVDSTARGTITADPDLTMDEVGIPYEMAWDMYGNYVQRRLVRSGLSPAEALKQVRERSPLALSMLHKEGEVRPVIYSRAPAWHKYNTIAGKPVFHEGHHISISPLTTSGAGADFDGDTINLHVPSQDDAVEEAWEKLRPSKMLHSIRDADKVVPVPKQEMILGLYSAWKRPAQFKHVFPSQEAALAAIKAGTVRLSDEVVIGRPAPVQPPAATLAPQAPIQ
jgi:DNA-directed RNA polymerase beta' subunit